MKVTFAATAIADSSAFIMHSGHPFFQNAEARGQLIDFPIF